LTGKLHSLRKPLLSYSFYLKKLNDVIKTLIVMYGLLIIGCSRNKEVEKKEKLG